MIDALKLLEIWEEGRPVTPLARIILLLSAGHPQWTTAQIGRLTLGEKEAQLLLLRERLFGPVLQCVVACPQCDDPLEFEFTAADLGALDYHARLEPIPVELAGAARSIRPLTIEDLQWAQGRGDLLLRRSIVDQHHDESPAQLISILPQAAETVADALLQLDPLMQIQLDCACPNCDHHWAAEFAAITYVWAEIERWGRSMLNTVHLLAGRYGWSERDILQMSAWRRQRYVEMIT